MSASPPPSNGQDPVVTVVSDGEPVATSSVVAAVEAVKADAEKHSKDAAVAAAEAECRVEEAI